MNPDVCCAIYDLAVMPHALQDVLTWNVRTAIHCEASKRRKVGIFVCLDGQSTRGVDHLYFSELLGAFGTHPMFGDVFFYRQRGEMMARLREAAGSDPAFAATVEDFSHEAIAASYKERGEIPLLRSSAGCEPDVAGLITRRFRGRKIVTVQMPLAPEFGEWLAFFREAELKHPDVQFVALGRRPDKPLEALQLPNVACLRAWGLGLGHELTLLRQSDLFMGVPGGFAAMATFSRTPYFIARMTEAACRAHGLEPGAARFPFAGARQVLVHQSETRELLMELLDQGLPGAVSRAGSPAHVDSAIDVRSWEWERSTWLFPGATTYRFFDDADFADKETAFLLWPQIEEAQAAWRKGSADEAWSILAGMAENFPRLCARFPEFLQLRLKIASQREDSGAIADCKAKLAALASREKGVAGWARSMRRVMARGFPMIARLKYLWQRKHRIPVKLARLLSSR
jgi:hypothetical protein